MRVMQFSTQWTDHRRPPNDQDLSGADRSLIRTRNDLTHGSGWKPYDLSDLAHVSWVRRCTLQILLSLVRPVL